MPGDPTATTPPPQHVRIGRVGRAYQLEGGVRLQLDAGTPPHALTACERLFVAGYGPAAVRAVRLGDAAPLVYLEGVRDRDAARALVGAEVYAPATAVAGAAAERRAPDAGTPGAVEVGSEVWLGARLVGTVREVRAGGANPLLVVDAGAAELLLPLSAPYVRVDTSGVWLTDPPEGLLEP